jgi:hypothetical protein
VRSTHCRNGVRHPDEAEHLDHGVIRDLQALAIKDVGEWADVAPVWQCLANRNQRLYDIPVLDLQGVG